MAGRIFVAAEVGFWRNPKHVTFARAIGHPICGASYILRLREFFLTEGTRGVLPKKYTALDLAAAVDFDGKPAALVKALGPSGAGVLVRRRGRFAYAEWRDTSTGWWEQNKTDQREKKRRQREEERQGRESEKTGQGRDVPGTSRGRPGERRDQTNKQGAGAAGTPPAGPRPGGDLTAARLGWLEENYPLGIVDRAKVAELVGDLPEEEWAHVQHAALYMCRKKNPSFVATVERFLGKRLYRLVKLPKPVRPKAPGAKRAEAKKPEPTAADLEEQRWFQRLGEIKEQLRAEGLRGDELLARADELLEAEQLAARPKKNGAEVRPS